MWRTDITTRPAHSPMKIQLLAEIMSGADDVKVIGTWLNGPAHEGYMVLRWRISPPKPTTGTNCGSWRSYNDSCNWLSFRSRVDGITHQNLPRYYLVVLLLTKLRYSWVFDFFNEFNKSSVVEVRPDLVSESFDAWAETKNLTEPSLDILVIIAIFPLIFKLHEI